MNKLHTSDETKVSPLLDNASKESTDRPSRWLSPFEEMSYFFENLSARTWMRS